VYIVSIRDGQLQVGSRLEVEKIVSRASAIRIAKSPNLFEAQEWVIGKKRSSSRLHLHRQLSPELARHLRFKSAGKSIPLLFADETKLDVQTTRGIRELTLTSAMLLDLIIERTEKISSGDTLAITEEVLWAEHFQRVDERRRMCADG
jgi:hypothetical protein